MYKYWIYLFSFTIGMKSIIFAAKSLVIQNSSRLAAQEHEKPETRDHGDFSGLSAKGRVKAESCEALSRSSHKKRQWQYTNPAPAEKTETAGKSPEGSVPSKPTTRGAPTRKSRDQPEVDAWFSHERVLAVDHVKWKDQTKTKFY